MLTAPIQKIFTILLSASLSATRFDLIGSSLGQLLIVNMLKYALVIVLVALLGCVTAEPSPSDRYLPSLPSRKAVAVLVGTATGTIYFTETADGILVTGTISNITPGKHGFHIHSKGDLSNGCISTGGHFNPANKTHGSPTDSNRHVGDLGNIEAGQDGIAKINIVDKIISLDGVNNILGRAVLVHADEDDLGKGNHDDSLTTGHAGARVGCGVIGTLNDEPSGSDRNVASLATVFTILCVALKNLLVV